MVAKGQRHEPQIGEQPSTQGAQGSLASAGLGPLEARILGILWLRESATVPDIVVDVRDGGHRVAYTTVQTVVSRLHRRGLLGRAAEGRSHRYRPLVSQAEFLSHASDAAVATVLERFGPSALRHFALRVADLDPDTRRELIDLATAERSAHGALDGES